MAEYQRPQITQFVYATSDNLGTSGTLYASACLLYSTILSLGNDAASARIGLSDSTALADVSGKRSQIFEFRVASGLQSGMRQPLSIVFYNPVIITGGLHFEGTATASLTATIIPIL